MKFQKAKKLVIVTEEIILDKIIKLIINLGAIGYTVQNVKGRGGKGVRSETDINGLFKNIRIETITSNEAVARKIATEVQERFYKYYSGIVYIEDIEIIKTKQDQMPD